MDQKREEQLNNPLHGLKLKELLQELVDHYGWEVLADQININCFKSYPTIESSLKFLKKTEWAREKLEIFYLYKFKRLPKPDDEQYLLPPRQRTIYLDQSPRSPAVITPTPKENIEKSINPQKKDSKGSQKKEQNNNNDPWAKWKK